MTNPFFSKPSLFSPVVVRALEGTWGTDYSFGTFDSSQVSDSVLGNSASFRYDPMGTGLKSTQQLNVDYSSFENHVFFHSAKVKTNVSFVKIIDNFPFDGTQQECEYFFDTLNGYEKYVFDLFPKNRSYLFFSGTKGTENSGGTYVTTKDIVGADYPTLTRVSTGKSVLNPTTGSLTLEFHLFVPTISSSNQVILQKVSGTTAGDQQGFGVYLNSTGSTTSCSLTMGVLSGTYSVYTNNFDIGKGQFNHLAFTWDRTPGVAKISAFLNHNLVATSSIAEIGTLNCDSARFYIGSGSAVSGFTPQATLSGAMDELRVWHSIRSLQERQEFEKKNVFSNENLKLYYKFNECSGSDTQLILDHSGNGLHGKLSAEALLIGVREIPSGNIAGDPPLTFEREELNPVLFPDVSSVSTLQNSLLTDAEDYDNNNPNLITNLFPPHYFLEGQYKNALSTVEGNITEDFVSYGPAEVQPGETQVLLGLMWMWASFFDELKLYMDAFANTINVDYNDADTAPDQFLQVLADRYGIQLPQLFTGASINQFINAENTETYYNISPNSLQKIQNQIWRRLLINIRDVLNSKGTVHSIKAFIRTLGIDPDNNFKIREYGGPTKKTLHVSREQRSEVMGMLSFASGGLVTSPYLSSSRIEPGYPLPVGATHDGLWTSGSWTCESIVNLTNITNNQSLVRMRGRSTTKYPTFLNLVAVSGSSPKLSLHFMANYSQPDLYTLVLSGVNLFDGNNWNVCFGRQRADAVNSDVSSSYFLRCARSNFGNIQEYYVTSSFFDDILGDSTSNVWSYKHGTINKSGSLLVVGSGTLDSLGYGIYSLTEEQQETRFNGRMSQLRFWSKDLSETEWKEHVRNYKSIGVENPDINFNFVTNQSGSFERIRIDASVDQFVTQSDGSGNIQIFDFSQNSFHLSGTNFLTSSNVIIPHTLYYSYISPHFDEAVTNNKVRIRSFQNFDNVLNDEENYAQTAPVYDIDATETPRDSSKFSIDYSITDVLNQDIVNMFSSLDKLDNDLGNPELLFGGDYPGLDNLRNVYFNRLTDKINLKTFFEFYKWFDANIGNFITQLIPRKVKFLGINYVLESHMLERPRFEYQFADSYLGDSVRHTQKDTIYLQFFNGEIAKY